MKIEKVTLQNIGVYVNRNEFDLRADRPIILIGGMNGRGKTTFLEAILFVLYGKRFLDASQNLDGYLRKISNISGTFPECFIEMEFQVQEQGETTFYGVKRSWDISRKKPAMKTLVRKNGEEKRALSDNWDLFVEEILPRAIAPFFFFDGEKIAELAATENDVRMKNSIRALLGIDKIDQLITDLQTVISSNQKQLHRGEYREQLEQLEAEEKRQEKLLEDREEKYGALQLSLERLRQEKTEIENAYLAAGGGYAEYQSRFREQRQRLQAEMEENRGRLRDLAASSLPLKLVEPLLEEIRGDAEKEKNQRELEIFLRQFPELYRDYAGEQEMDGSLQRFLAYARGLVSPEQENLQLDEDARERLSEMPEILRKEGDQARELLRNGQRLSKENEELNNYLAVTVEEQQVKEFQQKLMDNSRRTGQMESKLLLAEQDCRESRAELENLQKQKKQLLGQLVKEQEEFDENLRIISYARMQIEIMESYRQKLQALKADHLAGQMTECFQKIIAKKGLIQEIRIDHETLEFSYYNKDGRRVEHQMLSSGEKQMLVIAMLWALGICSRAEFPLIIDTPLARLDSVHRASLIENYFPKASEQVIILSTDQEITEQDYRALKNYVGREYTLVYDVETMSSSIQPGYFGGNRE